MSRVLLVEDDKKIVLALSYKMRAFGHTMACAPDAISAMSEAIRVNPDIVLLDINLPGGNGFVVADRLRSGVETSKTPIVFITASRNQQFRKRAREIGADGFLEKPFDSTELIYTIDRIIGPGSDRSDVVWDVSR